MAKEHGIECVQSTGSDAKTLPIVNTTERKIITNHGAYELPTEEYCVQHNVIGMTEHTLNGERRFEGNRKNSNIAFKSAAQIDLKKRSDRDISYSIAKEIIQNNKQIGKSITSHNSNEVILLIGYGTMGHFIAQELQRLHCTAEIIIDDIRDKQKVFALQDGFTISKNLDDILPLSLIHI